MACRASIVTFDMTLFCRTCDLNCAQTQLFPTAHTYSTYKQIHMHTCVIFKSHFDVQISDLPLAIKSCLIFHI